MKGAFVYVTTNNARVLLENRSKEKCVKLKWKQIKQSSLSRHCVDHISILCFTNGQTTPPPSTPAPQTPPELATSRRQGGDELVSTFCSENVAQPMCKGRVDNYQKFVVLWIFHRFWNVCQTWQAAKHDCALCDSRLPPRLTILPSIAYYAT
jgi:hypothetical protein